MRPDVSDPGNAERIVVVTGMSGAGRSTALKAMEDLGFEAVDNLPLRLVPSLVMQGPPPNRGLAVGVDIRSRGFDVGGFTQALSRLRSQSRHRIDLLFVDSEDEVLRRRYTETRRMHPLAGDRSAADGIAEERRMLAPLRDAADMIIDSSATTAREFAGRVQENFADNRQTQLRVFVTSFAFRHGLPRDADLVFDVRFLRNPHYDEALRPMTGLDAPVGAFIIEDGGYASFFERLTDLLSVLLPRYLQEGKSYLSIAIGCTGGKHRSVYTAEALHSWLREVGYATSIGHRDLEQALLPDS